MVSTWASAAATAVEDRLLRALTPLRVILLINAVALNVYRADSFQRPLAGTVCVVAMIAWTGYAAWAYADARRRTRWLLGADLGLALTLLLSTPLVKGSGFNATVPGFWIAGALLAWAVHYRLPGGLFAGVLLASVDLVLRDHIQQSDYNNAFLLVITGSVVGFMCGSLQQMATERDAAERAAAMATERARLARAVHDGVLQVLALMQRHGAEHEGVIAELGDLAGEQEQRLRALIRAEDASGVRPAGSVDIVAALTRLERPGIVTVAVPAFAVDLPAPVAEELLAAARACLDNVRHHVGEDAPAWLLLEAFPDRVELSVRDQGPGIPEGRLDEAASQGRLGVSEAIRGRLDQVGGTASLTSDSLGTEWQLVVPREQDRTLRQEAS